MVRIPTHAMTNTDLEAACAGQAAEDVKGGLDFSGQPDPCRFGRTSRHQCAGHVSGAVPVGAYQAGHYQAPQAVWQTAPGAKGNQVDGYPRYLAWGMGRPYTVDMKSTHKLEKAASILALVIGLAISAQAQTISADFSKAAITSLVASHSAPASDISAKALVDAEAAAASPAEDAVVKQLKDFAFAGVMANLKAVAAAQQAELLHIPVPASIQQAQDKLDTCYTTWKASLRNLAAAQPDACK